MNDLIDFFLEFRLKNSIYFPWFFSSWAKGTFSLTILLGITWILGYLLLVDDPWVGTLAAYSFTIFNASQVYQYSNHNVTKYVGEFNNLLVYSRFHRFSYLMSKNYLLFLSQGTFLFIFNIVMNKGIRSKVIDQLPGWISNSNSRAESTTRTVNGWFTKNLVSTAKLLH